jgi:serine/threonine protein kinase
LSVVAGRFELLAAIGSGGVAEVHRARDLRSGDLVALKQLLPQLTADRAVSRRFVREAEAARALDHPGIVRVLEAGEADGRPYLAMELVDGEDLRRRLDREGHLPWPEARRIARALAEALAHAHTRGVVHRDVKPHNVLLAGDAVKLGDFGLARVESMASLTGSSVVWGSPEYMAPELFGRGRADPRTDLFSLGVVLFEMVTGHVPWKDRSLARLVSAVTDQPAPLPSLGQGPALDRLMAALLSPSPVLRPATAGEVLAALEGFEDPAALVRQAPCAGCGEPRPEDIPRCFVCGHSDLAVGHTPGGNWSVRLKKIDDDAASMEAIHIGLGGLTGRSDLRLKFLVGNARLYSKKEREATIRLPALLFDELDETSAREIERVLAARGLRVAAARAQPLQPWDPRRRLVLAGGGAFVTAGLIGAGAGGRLALVVAGVGLMVAVVIGASRRVKKLHSLFRLRDRGTAAPTAERLLGAARQSSEHLGAPEVRGLFVEVSRELYRLARRAEELARHAPSGSSEEALARRMLAAAPSLGQRLTEIAQRLEALDAALSVESESETLRALATVERSLPAAPPDRRVELEQIRRDLEATCEHRRVAENEREQLAAALCRMLATVREVYRRARSLRTVEEHEAEAIAVALAELERG